MPDYDHPGFTYWPGNDPGFPIGVPDPTTPDGAHVGASAKAAIALPQAAPGPKIVAARFIAFQHSAKLWFALECTTVNGQLTYEGVLRGQHLYYWEDHGEHANGEMIEIRLTMAELQAAGSKEVARDHGHHCDSLFAHWGNNNGTVSIFLSVLHFEKSKRQYLADLEEAARHAETGVIEDVPLPPEPEPGPTPEPPPMVAPGT
jgi:hypothetical protein